MYCVTIFYNDGTIQEFATKDFKYVVSAVKLSEDDDDCNLIQIKFISEVKN